MGVWGITIRGIVVGTSSDGAETKVWTEVLMWGGFGDLMKGRKQCDEHDEGTETCVMNMLVEEGTETV